MERAHFKTERQAWIDDYLETVNGSADLVTAEEYVEKYPASRFAIWGFIMDTSGEA